MKSGVIKRLKVCQLRTQDASVIEPEPHVVNCGIAN